MKYRYLEVDLLRTLAILMMIAYHFAYDLEFYYGWDIGIFEGIGWIFLRQSTAALFLLLVGVSFAISWDRTPTYRKYLKRGLGVIACGMLVSAATYWWEPETYVRFGILHMIGASILLLPLFTKMKEGSAVVGLIIMILGMIMPPPTFTSVDYFPLIPWFGVVLLGYAIGHALYIRQRGFRGSSSDSSASSDSPHARRRRALAWPGRHALILYLLHQPLLLLLLKIVMDFLTSPSRGLQ